MPENPLKSSVEATEWRQIFEDGALSILGDVPCTACRWRGRTGRRGEFCQIGFWATVEQTQLSEKQPRGQCSVWHVAQFLLKLVPLLCLCLGRKFRWWARRAPPSRVAPTVGGTKIGSPFLNTQRASGTWPFKGSSLPTTAQSATVPWERRDCNFKRAFFENIYTHTHTHDICTFNWEPEHTSENSETHCCLCASYCQVAVHTTGPEGNRQHPHGSHWLKADSN